jgi:hypothetical protein
MKQFDEVLRLKDDEIEWRSVEDQIVILHRGDWEYLTVNEAGTLLWTKLLGGATRTDLVSLLLAEYDVDEVRAADDVETFLALLSERDLLALDVPGGTAG